MLTDTQVQRAVDIHNLITIVYTVIVHTASLHDIYFMLANTTNRNETEKSLGN